jgi:Peptidase family M23
MVGLPAIQRDAPDMRYLPTFSTSIVLPPNSTISTQDLATGVRRRRISQPLILESECAHTCRRIPRSNDKRRLNMSWKDIMHRVLPPIERLSPHVTSAYGVMRETKKGRKPHGGVDFNYFGGQAGINLEHPALRSPVTGVVTNAGEGTVGRIAIKDADGFTHEILHTDTRHIAVGDPVVAGQLIGTMGNTGAEDQHVHYQLKDPAGNNINPTDYWDRQGPVDPNPAPPAYIQEYQRYLQGSNGAVSPDRPDSFDSRFGNWPSWSFGFVRRSFRRLDVSPNRQYPTHSEPARAAGRRRQLDAW